MTRSLWGGLLLSAAAGLAEAAELKAPIASVTVYSDRARVTRRCPAAPFAGGRARLVLKGLPDALQDDSVRVSFPGAPWARVLSVEVEREFRDRFNSEEARLRQEAVRALEEEGRRLDAREQALAREAELLQGLAVGSQPRPGDQPQPKPLAPESWGKVLDEVSRGLLENAQGRTEAARARRDWGRRMAAAQQALSELGSMHRLAEKTVSVEADGMPAVQDRAAAVAMEVSYLVPGARWSPTYDVRVLPEERRVQVLRYAEVRQTTGEDWTEADLVCSTAVPAVSATLPELMAWTFSEAPRIREYAKALKRPVPDRRPENANAVGERSDGYVAGLMKEKGDADLQKCEDKLCSGEMSRTQAGEGGAWKAQQAWIPPCVLSGGYDYAFPAVRPETVKSDGKPSRVALGSDAFPAETFYEAAPLASPFAYLTCELRNTSAAPYLAGPDNLFLAGDFLGAAPLGTVGVGETVSVPLGVDEKVKVVRKARDLKGTAGFFRSKQRTDTEVEITATSFLKDPVRLRILDRAPYAFQEDVEVEVSEVRPALREPAKKGLMAWDLALQPGKPGSVAFRYGVTAPEDFELEETPDPEGAR